MAEQEGTEQENEFAKVMARVWGSPDGQYLLRELTLRHGASLFDSDALKMARKIGKLEMIQYCDGFVRRQ